MPLLDPKVGRGLFAAIALNLAIRSPRRCVRQRVLYDQYSKSPSGFRYIGLNLSSTAFSSVLGSPNTVKVFRSAIALNRVAKRSANTSRCATAAPESEYRS